MQERLLTLEMDKQRLLTLYTDNDRRVQDKEQEIEAQKKRLAEVQAQQWVPDNEVTQLNDRRRDLEEKILAARLAAQKNKIRYEGAKTITAEMRERVQDLGLADVAEAGARCARSRRPPRPTCCTARRRKKPASPRPWTRTRSPTSPSASLPLARERPLAPPKNLSLLFAVMVGLVSGVGGAFLREFFDGSIKSEHEIRSSVDLPVLGSISGREERQEERQRTRTARTASTESKASTPLRGGPSPRPAPDRKRPQP